MASPSRDILIVGAGVLGLSTAAILRARGHAVTVVDPGGPNASSVAAGMIAPAMESAIEDVTPERAALYRAGADLWPDFAERHGVDLEPASAEWRGEGADAIHDRLVALGFAAQKTDQGVQASDDMRLSPNLALARLSHGLRRVEGWAKAVAADAEGWTVELSDGGVLTSQALVIAVGPEAMKAAPDVANEVLARVMPIRGQIGLIAKPLIDHTLRGPDGYVTPVEGGAVIGATMDAGRRDLTPDPEAARRLHHAAEVLLGQPIDPAAIAWRVGVRGASEDGLPLAGLIAPGLAVALAPRRNGWLLGPLVGEVVADAIEDRTPRAEATALDPLRFSREG